MNEIYTENCPNGIRIVHEKMPYAHSVTIGIWIKVGSLHEVTGEEGLAHFIEHMLFKGTNQYSYEMIAKQFDEIGGELNAFTSKEETCLYVTVLKEDAALAIQLLSEMLMDSTFQPLEIEKEKEVILEEIAMYEDTPEDYVHEQLWMSMYPNHPIGLPVLGNDQSIKKITRHQIQSFMAREYLPERIVVSIAGNYDENCIKLVHQLFGFWKNDLVQRCTNEFSTPIFQPRTWSAEKEVEQGHICLGYETSSIQANTKYSLSIVNHLIGGSMSSRLFQEMREKEGLAYTVYSYFAQFEQTGAFIIYGGTNASKIDQFLHKTTEVLSDSMVKGFDASTINAAKKSVKSSFLLGLESTESRMSRNGHQVLFYNEVQPITDVLRHIEQVRSDEIEKVLLEIFSKPYATAILSPDD